jgi:hypothetical protein
MRSLTAVAQQGSPPIEQLIADYLASCPAPGLTQDHQVLSYDPLYPAAMLGVGVDVREAGLTAPVHTRS